jgi:putative glutamine amidotransferase
MPRIAVAPNDDLDDYLESVRAAGGEPVRLDPRVHNAAEVSATIDGVLLTGGKDVDPKHYGEAPDPTIRFAGDVRDGFEIELVIRALERDVPMLTICRGMQVLNVALGGTLVQDIPSSIPSALDHRVKDPKHAIAHEVHVTPASQLANAMWPGGSEGARCAVNSRHHQALKRIADSLVVTATAPDGIVEGVERPDSRFCLGVQWHPENFWRTGEFLPLFEALVRAAARR